MRDKIYRGDVGVLLGYTTVNDTVAQIECRQPAARWPVARPRAAAHPPLAKFPGTRELGQRRVGGGPWPGNRPSRGRLPAFDLSDSVVDGSVAQ